MSDETKPAITEGAKPAAETVGHIGAEGAKPEQAAAKSSTVLVRPIRAFLDSSTKEHVTPETEPYQVERSRAAELRANGLIEFVNTDEEREVLGDRAKLHADRIAQRAKQDEIPANSKGKPLENPKIEREKAPAKEKN